MVENTRIEWADHTLNWWTGCEHVSPACDGCYAEAWAKRAGRDFAVRKLTTQANRDLPFKWQGDYEWRHKHGRRQRVFVNSLSDFFDNKVPNDWREQFFRAAKLTPNVIYLLLTKRIGNAIKMLPDDWGEGYQNVWIGATVVTQEELQRDVLKLLRTPAVKHFVSIEPMLGPIDLRHISFGVMPGVWCTGLVFDALNGMWSGNAGSVPEPHDTRRSLPEVLPPIDWVIAGGESGPLARPISLHWLRALRDQCASSFTPFFFKQWGEWISASEESAKVPDGKPMPRMYPFPNSVEVALRVGKKHAGALLDGREHKEHPYEVFPLSP